MNAVRQFLAGKKTYIGATVLALFGAWLVFKGQSDLGMYAITTAATFVGLGARVNRHRAEVLQAIQSINPIVQDIHLHGSVSKEDVAKFLEENKPAITAALSDSARAAGDATTDAAPAAGAQAAGAEAK